MDEIKVGDAVLFYGFNLRVFSIEERDGRMFANLKEPDALARREALREQLDTLRAQQVNATGAEHAELAERIKALSQQATETIMNASLQVASLSYWPERGVWVSDGRILTDEQNAVAKKLFGSKPLPSAQRMVLGILEPYMATPEYKEAAARMKAAAEAEAAAKIKAEVDAKVAAADAELEAARAENLADQEEKARIANEEAAKVEAEASPTAGATTKKG